MYALKGTHFSEGHTFKTEHQALVSDTLLFLFYACGYLKHFVLSISSTSAFQCLGRMFLWGHSSQVGSFASNLVVKLSVD